MTDAPTAAELEVPAAARLYAPPPAPAAAWEWGN
jgi:hypothetical protein